MAAVATGDGAASGQPGPNDWEPLESLQTPQSRCTSQAHRITPGEPSQEYDTPCSSPAQPQPNWPTRTSSRPITDLDQSLTFHDAPSLHSPDTSSASAMDSSAALAHRRRKSQAARMMTPEELSEFGPLGGPAPDVSDRYIEWGSRRASRRISRDASLTNAGHSRTTSPPFSPDASADATTSSSLAANAQPHPLSGTPPKGHQRTRSTPMASTPTHQDDTMEGGTSIPHTRARMVSIRRKRLSQLRRGDVPSEELQEFGPLGGIKRGDALPSGSVTPCQAATKKIPTVARRARLSRAHEVLAAAAAAGGGEAQRQLVMSRNDPHFDMGNALAMCGLVDTWDIHGNPYDLKQVSLPPLHTPDQSGTRDVSQSVDAPATQEPVLPQEPTPTQVLPSSQDSVPPQEAPTPNPVPRPSSPQARTPSPAPAASHSRPVLGSSSSAPPSDSPATHDAPHKSVQPPRSEPQLAVHLPPHEPEPLPASSSPTSRPNGSLPAPFTEPPSPELKHTYSPRIDKSTTAPRPPSQVPATSNAARPAISTSTAPARPTPATKPTKKFNVDDSVGAGKCKCYIM